MAVEFKIIPHGVYPDRQTVVILVDGEIAGIIYPMGEKGIKLVSAHMRETQVDNDFVGVVVEDDGSRNWPPIPAVLIGFDPSPYRVVGNKIVKEEREK